MAVTMIGYLLNAASFVRKWMLRHFWPFQPRFSSGPFEGNWPPFNRVYLTRAAAKTGNLVKTLGVLTQVWVK